RADLVEVVVGFAGDVAVAAAVRREVADQVLAGRACAVVVVERGVRLPGPEPAALDLDPRPAPRLLVELDEARHPRPADRYQSRVDVAVARGDRRGGQEQGDYAEQCGGSLHRCLRDFRARAALAPTRRVPPVARERWPQPPAPAGVQTAPCP